MIPYLITFAISTILLYVSQKIEKDPYRKLVVAIALLLPCVLAGARALSIGTDTQVYLKPMFDATKSSDSFSDFLNRQISGSRYAKDYEIGFTFLTYLIISLFGNIHILMFTIEALMIIPIYFGCKKIGPLKNKTWLCMLVYYLLFYNIGLNTMREFIALSIAFYGISIILAKEKHRIFKYLILITIAFLFHKSALLSISVATIYFLLSRKKILYLKYGHIKLSANIIKACLLLLLAVILLVNIDILNGLFYSIDGFERYTGYYDGNLSLSLTYILKVLPLVATTALLSKRFYKTNEDSLFFLIIFYFSSIIFGFLSTTSSYGGRISNGYKIFDVMYLPLITISPTTSRGQKTVTAIIIAYALFYWWFTFVSRGYSETVPYILGV